jgi:hypothetical protein
MNKQDLIKIEDIAIRVAGDQMATMYKPNFPQGICSEVQKLREVERAYSEGFKAGAAYYRHLLNCINEEFLDLVEGVRIDSGSAEDTHSVTEMAMKNGIPVITTKRATTGSKTAKQMEAVRNYIATVPFDLTPEEAKEFAEQHTTENEPAEPKKDDSPVGETMESCINATPEQCQSCDSNAACPRSCADIEKIREQQKLFAKKLDFPIERAKADPEKKVEEPKHDETQPDTEDIPLWKHPIDTIEKVLQNLNVKFELEGNGNILYMRFIRGDVEYTIYFQKEDDGNYKVVFSDRDAHGGKVLCEGVITDSMTLMALERSITEHIKGW